MKPYLLTAPSLKARGEKKSHSVPESRPGKWLALLSDNRAVALLDQAVVSGTNFLTTVLIGRWCGSSALGAYSLGFTIVVIGACIQDSLLTVPYTMLGKDLAPEDRRRRAGSTLIHYLVFSGLLAVLIAITALVLLLFGQQTPFLNVLAVLALVVPGTLLRELIRRMAFAHLKMSMALLLDTGVALLQLSALLLLYLLGGLSPATAHLAIGGLCALVAGTALYCSRQWFAARRTGVLADWKAHWGFGKWVAVSQSIGVVHGFVLYWLIAAALGSTATGDFTACMTLVLLTNPLILGIGNVLGPTAARAMATEGAQAVGRMIGKAMALVTSVLAAIALALFFLGAEILAWLYHIRKPELAPVISVLAVAVLLGAVGIVAEHGVRALGKPDIALKTSFIGLVTTVVLATVLMQSYGILGAALGYLFGSLTSSGLRAWLLLRVLAGGKGAES